MIFPVKYFVFFLLCFSFLNSQNLKKIDSLELLLEFTENSQDSIEKLLALSEEFITSNPRKALGFSKKAFELSKEIGGDTSKLSTMISLTEIYCSLSDFKTAMEYAQKSIVLAEELGKLEELAKSYQLIGLIYSDLGDFQESSKYYFQCLELYEQINNKEGKSKALSRIASVYFDQKNYDKALEYYFQALEIAKSINDREGIAGGLNDIAAVYGNREENEKVTRYLEESVLINSEIGNKRAVAINYTNLGIINQRLENFDEALVYFQKSHKLFKEINHELLIGNCEVVISSYYLEINKLDLSIDYAKSAFDIGNENGLKKLIYDATGMLYLGFLEKKDTILANKYLILQYKMKDSLEIEKSATQLTKLEIRYEFEKEKHQQLIAQQRKDFIFLIIIISLVLGIGIVIMFFARQKIKIKNTELEKKHLKGELEFKNKELALKVMSLLKKNELLSEISKKLLDVKNEAVKEETKLAISKIYYDLKKSSDDEIWKEFELRFSQVHSEFYKKLLEKFPDLSPNEQRLCALLKLNMSSKEISELTGQNINALETARYRLRKKLRISNSQINLITFLSQI